MPQSFDSQKKWSPRLLAALALAFVITSMIIAFFYPVLFKDRQFAFRDDSYFYIPLFQQIQEYYRQGEFPLWDPDTNLGQPLAANPATSVYYPVKLVFFLSCFTPLSFHTCYKFYTLFHVVWGMCGMCFMMRRFKCSHGASIISSMAYMFAGNVVILYCNIIFLIGAAWIPWIVLCGDRLLRSPGLGNVSALAVVLALTVLGGDPQAAYCTGLALVALAFFYWRTGLLSAVRQYDCDQVNTPVHSPFKICFQRVMLLFFSAVVAALLAAVQIIPSSELTQNSNRTLSDMPYSVWDVPPVSVWDIPGYLGKWNAFPPGKTPEQIAANRPASRTTGIMNGLFCRKLSEGGHAREIYSFSVMPYHFMDLLWPNFGGKGLPENGKWDRYAVGWFNSMYMGAFVFLLALTAVRLRLKKSGLSGSNSAHKLASRPHSFFRRTLAVWATWIVVITGLASLGGYGPYWFWRIFAARGNTEWAMGDGDPVGGMYWFFTVFLPGFEGFRYPAKMTVFVSFALAILAGIGWDCCRTKKSLPKLCSWGIWLSLFALFFVCVSGVRLFEITPPPDTLLGAYSPQVAFNNVRGSLIQTVLVLISFRLLLSWNIRLRKPKQTGQEHNRPISHKRRNAILVCTVSLLLLLDLYGANSSIIITSPVKLYRQQSPLAETIQKERIGENRQEVTPARIYSMDWYPLVLTKRKGPHKDFLRGLWDRMSLLPNQHYSHHLQNVNLTGTMVVDEYYFCLAWAEILDKNDTSSLLAFLDVEDLILPRVISIPEQGNAPIIKLDRNNIRLLAAAEKDATDYLDTNGIPTDVALWHITLPTSRIKIFHNCSELDDPMFTTIDLVRSGRLDDRHENEYAKITEYAHNRLEFEAHLIQPGDIVLAEQYFPGWKANIYRLDNNTSTSGQPLEIRQTLGFLRRVSLDAGTYRVVMEYWPRTFLVGAGISSAAWLSLGLIAIVLFFRKRQGQTRNSIPKPFEPEGLVTPTV